MMILDSELLSIEKELKETPSLDAFILKYHRTEHPEVRFMIVSANWKQIKKESDAPLKLRLLKKFIIQNRPQKDDRVKRLVALSIAQLLKEFNREISAVHENDLCNEIIELSQSFNGKDTEIGEALLDIYWRKAKQIEDKDHFKTNYFYNRIILLCHGEIDEIFIIFKFKAKIAKATLALKAQENVVDKIVDILSNIPNMELNADIQMMLLQLIYDFLESLNGLHRNVDIKQKIAAIEQMVIIQSFIPLLNLFKNHDLVVGILHHLTFIFWLDNNEAKAEILVHQYLQHETRGLSQIIDNNYSFQMSDDIDIQAFNDYIEKQYDQFAQKQKYRDMFKVTKKDIQFD